MKVRISMPESSIAVNFDEEKAFEVYGKLNETLMSLKKKEVMQKLDSKEENAGISPYDCNIDTVKNDIPPNREIYVDTASGQDPVWKPKYKGFLYIKCPECEHVKGFYTKKEMDRYHCENCDATTEFEKPLVLMWVNCECGGRFRYMTNMTDPVFDVVCLECGSPVAVQWNERKGLYETIK